MFPDRVALWVCAIEDRNYKDEKINCMQFPNYNCCLLELILNLVSKALLRNREHCSHFDFPFIHRWARWDPMVDPKGQCKFVSNTFFYYNFSPSMVLGRGGRSTAKREWLRGLRGFNSPVPTYIHMQVRNLLSIFDSCFSYSHFYPPSLFWYWVGQLQKLAFILGSILKFIP